MTKPGFTYIDEGTERRIYFMELRGKDISFLRWRLTLYYAPGFAATALFNSHEEYEQFCADHEGQCYSDFDEFKKECGEGQEGEDADSRNWLILVRLNRMGYNPEEARQIAADLESGKIENMDGVKPKEKHND